MTKTDTTYQIDLVTSPRSTEKVIPGAEFDYDKINNAPRYAILIKDLVNVGIAREQTRGGAWHVAWYSDNFAPLVFQTYCELKTKLERNRT